MNREHDEVSENNAGKNKVRYMSKGHKSTQRRVDYSWNNTSNIRKNSGIVLKSKD